MPDSADSADTRALLNSLADARLVVTSVNGATQRDEVEVAHDALIRHWPRLLGWLADGRAFLLWRQRLGTDLASWEANQRDEGSLLRGAALANAQRWLESRRDSLNVDERGYVEAGVQNDQARRRRKVKEAEERAALANQTRRQAEGRARAEETARRQAERDARRLTLSVMPGLASRWPRPESWPRPLTGRWAQIRSAASCWRCGPSRR